jgi:hypothetical protein
MKFTNSIVITPKNTVMKYLIGILILAAIVTLIVVVATNRFNHRYLSDVKQQLREMAPVPPEILTEERIKAMPLPVQKYLRYSGAVGEPVVNNVRVNIKGQIRAAEDKPWMQLTSDQHNFQDSGWRLFFLKARMMGLPVAGYHAFKNGTAFMDIRLLSLIKVQYHDGERMDVSETVTFFNDMCCMAPGSLADDRIEWLETEGNVVKAAFTNNGIRITAWLHFNDEGQLVNFISNDRWALEDGGKMSQVPWETPLSDYQEINGHRLATRADLIYKYPAGDICYGEFNIRSVRYNVEATK